MESKLKATSSIGLLSAAAILLYLFAIVRKAWIGDDAFITLHAVDNFINGYGFVSNPPERVQGFTNILWALVLTVPCALGVSGYAAAIGTGLLSSGATAIWVARRAAASQLVAAVVLLWLVSSSAYVDFSTSGLENPLAHLLLAIFFTEFIRQRLDPRRIYPWLLASLIALNRYDHALLIAPALVALLFKRRTIEGRGYEGAWARLQIVRPLTSLVSAIAIGLAPFLLWISISIVYYGFPFPNTAYAKLNAHITSGELFLQGLWYVVDSLKRDPLTLLVIALGLFTMAREGSRTSLATGIGVLLYLWYILCIGGDFMAGRFFTAPFIVCVIWLALRGLPSIPQGQVTAIAIGSAALGLIFSNSYNVADKYECPIGISGIVNERLCYAELLGLTENLRISMYKSHRAYKRGVDLLSKKRHTAVITAVGMTGYAVGHRVHIIDPMALTDPLLARIPYVPKGSFRIGHFLRDVPEGYEETLETGHNVIKDPCLRSYYSVLARVIRGPLFTRARWQAIVDLNFGTYDYLLVQPCPLTPKSLPSS